MCLACLSLVQALPMGQTWVDLVDLSAGCRESLAPVCALAQSAVCEHLLRGSSSLYCMVRCACAPAQRPSAFPLQSHPTTRRDEEKHGMQHDGGRVLLCSSWIGTPRGLHFHRETKVLGPGKAPGKWLINRHAWKGCRTGIESRKVKIQVAGQEGTFFTYQRARN